MLALLAGLILAPGAFACAPASPPVLGSLQLASLTLTGAGKPTGAGPPPPSGGQLDFSKAANSGLQTLIR